MQRVFVILLLVVCSASGFGSELTKATAALCLFSAIAPLHDPEHLRVRFPVREIHLAESPWGDDHWPVDFAKRFFPPKNARNDGSLPVGFGPKDYEQRLRQFASDAVDERSLTYASPLPDGTRIKLHLVTGELLITNGKGELAAFIKLPIDTRAIGTLATTGQFFTNFTKMVTAPQKYGQAPQRFAQLTAGEKIGFVGFSSENQAVSHVDKHVLGIFPERGASMSPADKAAAAKRNAGAHSPEFIRLRQDYLHDVEASKGDASAEQRAYAKLKQNYLKAAEDFMQSDRPTALTFTRAEKRESDGQSTTQLLSFRFDTLTNEMAIFDRLTGKLITYHRVDMEPANLFLKNHGFPPVNTPLEYFFSMVQISHRP